jgi:DNA-directed RNA polymerase subunit omega
VRPKQLHESVVQSLQRVLPDEEDEADEVGSLSQSAEAMRLSAAAPARSTSTNGDYEA